MPIYVIISLVIEPSAAVALFLVSRLSRHASVRLFGAIVSGALLAYGLAMAAMVVHQIHAAGCFWAPREVPYHPGMTICPGQTAIGHIVIRPAARSDEL